MKWGLPPDAVIKKGAQLELHPSVVWGADKPALVDVKSVGAALIDVRLPSGRAILVSPRFLRRLEN